MAAGLDEGREVAVVDVGVDRREARAEPADDGPERGRVRGGDVDRREDLSVARGGDT